MEQDVQLYKKVLNHLVEGLMITNQSGLITYVNPAFTDVTGYSFDEVIGQNPRFLKSDLHDQGFYNEMWKGIANLDRWEGEIWNKRKNGDVYLEHLIITALRDESGNVAHYIGLLSDITTKRKVENSLWQSTHALKAVIEASPIAVITLDQDQKVTIWNPAAEEIFGWKREEIVHQPYPLIAQENKKEFAKIFDDVMLRNKKFTGLEVQRLTKDGFLKWVSLSTAKLSDNENNTTGFIAMFKDITDSKLAEARINFMALHDELTHLPNRRALKERIDEIVISTTDQNKTYTILFIDIDHFKKVNDSLGHQYGDTLLISLANRMSRCLGINDRLFRIGGDEFAVLLSDVESEQEIGEIAQKIINCIEEPVIEQGYEFHLSCSIGIAVYPNDGTDTETLLVNADTALYRIKDKGSHYQFYKPNMNEKAQERIVIENDLYRALERHEFELYYQPQIHVKTGKVVGAEALIRWNHPKWGLVSPAQFIPLAEETGLIIPIGVWVMRTACRQLKEWNEGRMEPISIAVNLSSKQFMKHNLISTVKFILEESLCNPNYLELEITESMAMDVSHTMNTLQELKQLGVQIGMDDFGTGYSSLHYLKRLPIDKLKIDQSFLKEITQGGNDAAIVATIISMAHNLNLKVTAEGVETEEQLQFLREHHCEEAQGYLFSRPIPAMEFSNKFLLI
ncbi:sensor domain-containing protein [Brevibacillus ginsengisoli]|uniref:sensor domain-containing protein n=1 Tax=Brevibacillus ginsengisoli TaxID=363854 RepID=UPI003CF8AA7C